MAGELLVRTFDAERYAEASPTIREFRDARTLSDSALRLLRDALCAPLPASSRLEFGIRQLERIVANEGLSLRLFLSPRAHIAALDAFVTLYCFDDAGAYDLLNGGGETWLVLEAGVVHLYEHDWFRRLLDGELEAAPPRAVPAECTTFLVSPTALDPLRQQLDAIVGMVAVQGRARTELEALQKLAARTRTRPNAGLAFEILV